MTRIKCVHCNKILESSSKIAQLDYCMLTVCHDCKPRIGEPYQMTHQQIKEWVDKAIGNTQTALMRKPTHYKDELETAFLKGYHAAHMQLWDQMELEKVNERK